LSYILLALIGVHSGHNNRGKVMHNWRPIWQGIGTHTARHTAGTLLRQVSSGNKALAKLVLGHAEEDVTDRYAKDKARLLAPAVLDAWQKILVSGTIGSQRGSWARSVTEIKKASCQLCRNWYRAEPKAEACWCL
jgi:hypothetical protein